MRFSGEKNKVFKDLGMDDTAMSRDGINRLNRLRLAFTVH